MRRDARRPVLRQCLNRLMLAFWPGVKLQERHALAEMLDYGQRDIGAAAGVEALKARGGMHGEHESTAELLLAVLGYNTGVGYALRPSRHVQMTHW